MSARYYLLEPRGQHGNGSNLDGMWLKTPPGPQGGSLWVSDPAEATTFTAEEIRQMQAYDSQIAFCVQVPAGQPPRPAPK